MDISCPPTVVSVLTYTHQKDTYLGELGKIHFPSVRDFMPLIQEAGKGCFLYCHNVSQPYHQFPLNPCEWPLIGLKLQKMYFVDFGLPFGLRSAARM